MQKPFSKSIDDYEFLEVVGESAYSTVSATLFENKNFLPSKQSY
jgi:hypothetical protein